MNNCWRRMCLIAILWLITDQAVNAQYKDMFASLESTTSSLPKESIKTSQYFDLFNPLGPIARSMRNKSYSCIDEPVSQYEKGLWIKLGSKRFQYKNQSVRLLDENNRLIAPDLQKYNKVVRQTVKMLRSLEKKSTYARNMIHTLENSDNLFTIALVKTTDSYVLFPLPKGRFGVLNNNAYAFQVIEKESLVVDYAPFDKIGSGAEIRWAPEHKKIKLAHELSHAYDANYGLVDDQLMQAYGEIMSAREIRALYHENIIRKELHMPMRTKASTGKALIWDDQPYTYPLPVPARH